VKLSVVVPVYNEADAIPVLLRRLTQTLDGTQHAWELVLIDDGSTDDTWALLQEAAGRDQRLRAVRLTRNFGHQVALTAGLTFADGDAVISMDGDLQHPPEVIPALLAKGDDGYDVVYAVRTSIDTEGWLKVNSARLFYWLLNRLTSLDLPQGGADFRYMTRRVVDAVLSMPERRRFLRGMTRWVGHKQTVIEYERGPRYAGRSRYTLWRMVSFAFDAIVSFSAVPLRLASLLGFFVSFLGFLYFLYVVGARLFTDTAVPGWASVTMAVLLLGGVQLLCLGIIGQYLGRMYDEAKGRPLFLVAEDTRQVSSSGVQSIEIPSGVAERR
jgi:glycosyltransferase involved in cell wall biosynthesis